MNPTPITRRRFTQTLTSTLATLPLLSLSPNLRLRAAPPMVQVKETKIISPPTHIYHGWPTLAQRSNGELLCVFSGGREAHVCPFGRVDLIQSFDHGQTWSWPRTLLDTAIDDRDAGVLETHNGTLLVTTFTSLAYEPILAQGIQPNSGWSDETRERWNAIQRRTTPEERSSQLGQWIIRSTDSGRTWSPPYTSQVNSPHGPINLSNKTQFYAGKELWTGQKRVGCSVSRDDGQTWQWLSEIPTRPGDNPQEYHELHAVETAPGHILVQIRNHNPQNNRETLQTESCDGGHTWTTPHPIGVWGLPSHLLKLRDGRILMTYGHRRPPFGNQARVSADQGKTWSAPLPLSEDGNGGDLGYPSTVELPNRELLTIWYELHPSSPKAVLRQARWSLES